MFKIERILFVYLIFRTAYFAYAPAPTSDAKSHIGQSRHSSNLDIISNDCKVIEQTLVKLNDLVDLTFKSETSSLKFYIKNFNTTCLIDIELNRVHKFNLNYVILIKLLDFFSTTSLIDDSQFIDFSVRCNENYLTATRFRLNRKIRNLIESMYNSLELDEDLKCDKEDTGLNLLKISQSTDELDAVLSSNKPYRLAMSDSQHQPDSRRNYFVYLIICFLVVIFLVFFSLLITYKLNRFYANRKNSPLKRKKSGTRDSPANSVNPFEFFSLFNRPNSSEYDFYFDAMNAGAHANANKNNESSSTENVKHSVNNNKTGSYFLTMSDEDASDEQKNMIAHVDDGQQRQTVIAESEKTNVAVAGDLTNVDGDTRSEYSTTDYERMNYVQNWIDSISTYRFIRINSLSNNQNHNNNNNSNFRVSTFQNKGQTYQTIEF